MSQTSCSRKKPAAGIVYTNRHTDTHTHTHARSKKVNITCDHTSVRKIKIVDSSELKGAEILIYF